MLLLLAQQQQHFSIFAWLLGGVGERVLRVTLYVVLLILVALSRLYIAAHFPHQVILGVVVGGCIVVIFILFLIVQLSN